MSEHEYPAHPYADLFPMMDAKTYAALKADIREHGQREPIVLQNGRVVDGRNRLKACLELGIEPQFCEMDLDVDPVPWIISLNLHRRHLLESQRAAIASEIATRKEGRPSKETPPIDGVSADRAAELLNVSTRQVERAKAVRRDASPEVLELVKSGEITINAAQNFAKAIPDKKDQAAIASKGPAEIKRVVSTATDIKRMESAAKVVIDGACPEIVDMVASGELAVSLAEKLVRVKAEDWLQQSLARQGVAAIREFVKKRELAEADKQRQRDYFDAAAEALTIPVPTTKAEAKASTKAVESAAPAPATNVDAGGDPDAVALAALKAAKNPCVTIERWLRQAQPDQVSQIWSLVDEMLATGKGGRK